MIIDKKTIDKNRRNVSREIHRYYRIIKWDCVKKEIIDDNVDELPDDWDPKVVEYDYEGEDHKFNGRISLETAKEFIAICGLDKHKEWEDFEIRWEVRDRDYVEYARIVGIRKETDQEVIDRLAKEEEEKAKKLKLKEERKKLREEKKKQKEKELLEQLKKKYEEIK